MYSSVWQLLVLLSVGTFSHYKKRSGYIVTSNTRILSPTMAHLLRMKCSRSSWSKYLEVIMITQHHMMSHDATQGAYLIYSSTSGVHY